jgi:hypothetical protein
MKYFRPFNNVKYPMDIKGSHIVEAVDIMKRVVFSDSSINNTSSFSYYETREGESPEIIAEKLYGNPDLYWILLLFNERFNQYTDWGAEQNSLESYYKYKYPGTALFILPPTDGTDGGNNSVGPSTKHFNKTDKVFTTDDGVESNRETEATVQSWDPSIGKLVVYGITGSVASFSAGATLGATASYGMDLNPLNPGATGYGTDVVYLAKIVGNDYNSVHHFEGSSGQIMNPLATPFQADGMQISMGSTGETGDHVETAITFGSTLLHQYVIGGSSTYTITNAHQEDRDNQRRRYVRILNPSLVPGVVERFGKLLKDVQ